MPRVLPNSARRHGVHTMNSCSCQFSQTSWCPHNELLLMLVEKILERILDFS